MKNITGGYFKWKRNEGLSWINGREAWWLTLITYTTVQSSNHTLTRSAFPQDSRVCVSCVASQSCWSPSAGCSSLAAASTWVDSSCRSNWPGPSPSTRARWGRAPSQQLQFVTFSSHQDAEASAQYCDDITLSLNERKCCRETPVFCVGFSLYYKMNGATFPVTA